MTRWNEKSNRIRLMKQRQISHTISCPDLIWLFMLGSVVGFVLEGLWCVFQRGAWEHHSATVWGPFCIIYGIGAVVVYLLASYLKGKNILLQFICFSVSGGFIEYFSSLFQEVCFGSTSWNYGKHFLNIGGRVSLKMTLMWGVLGILFVWLLFPLLNRLFSKMRGRFWKPLCIFVTVFMAVNLIVSAAAVARWSQRIDQRPAANQIEQYLDDTYGNDTMAGLFPNMAFTN